MHVFAQFHTLAVVVFQQRDEKAGGGVGERAGSLELREVEWGQIMAACFMSSLPLIVIFLVFRKTFISGITAGAFK